jgi:hypothetical protein
MNEDFITQDSFRSNRGFSTILSSEKGLTHIQLIEYFLLLFMMFVIIAIIMMGIPEVHAKLWGKISTEILQ